MSEVFGGSKELLGVIKQLQKGQIKQRDVTNKKFTENDAELYDKVKEVTENNEILKKQNKYLNEKVEMLVNKIDELSEWKEKNTEGDETLGKDKKDEEMENKILKLSSRVDSLQSENNGK